MNLQDFISQTITQIARGSDNGVEVELIVTIAVIKGCICVVPKGSSSACGEVSIVLTIA